METTLQTAAQGACAGKNESNALWNPTAAVLWSLLFSPALGAYLLMRNWERLGQAQKARQSRYWLIGVLALNLANLVAVTVGVAQERELGMPWWMSVALFCVWAVQSAYPQIREVDERHGEDYGRRSWAAPLLIAFVATMAFMFLTGALAIVVAG